MQTSKTTPKSTREREAICGDGEELEPLSGRFLFLASPSLVKQSRQSCGKGEG